MKNGYKLTQVIDEDHEWLRTEAFHRRTTITAELAEAIDLLRAKRARAAKQNEMPTRQQAQPAAVSA